MATRQEKVERAEAATKLDASDLEDVNSSGRVVVVEESEPQQQQEQRPGMVGSMLKAVQETYGHAKDAVVGKTQDAVQATKEGTEYSTEAGRAALKTGELAAKGAKDRTMEKAGEYKDYTVDKAKEAKDATAEKANEYKDYAVDKATGAKDYTAEKAKEAKDYTVDKVTGAKDYTAEKAKEAKDATADKAKGAKDYTGEKAKEATDYTGEKAKEGKDTTVGKLGELKDSTFDVAKKAASYFTGRRDDNTPEAAKEKLSEAEEATRQKVEDMKVKGEKYKDDVARKASEAQNTEAERGKAGSANIFGAIGSVTEAIKSKLTMPHDVVEETRVARDEGGGGKVEVRVKETRTGNVADALKASDQMTGQAFNDVGSMGDEDNTAKSDRQGKV